MNFMNAMKNENDNRKTLTENGAIAYQTTGHEILDFNFRLSGFRKIDENEIMKSFGRVYYEEPINAMRFLFWIRDIRGGAGERRVFRCCLKWLAINKPEIAKAVIPLVPKYARWDDLWCLLDTQLKNDVINLIKQQLDNDLKEIDKK